MQYKNKAFEKFLNQFEKMLKRYQSNRGEEFDNKAFKSLFLKHGVQWESSALYILKRLYYTLIISIWSILANMKLPKLL